MTRKIKITNTLYPDSIPNGTVMTITGWEPNGCVIAVKDGDSFPWFIDAGTFHVLDDTPIKLEVGKWYELNNGDVVECKGAAGDLFHVGNWAYGSSGVWLGGYKGSPLSVKREVPSPQPTPTLWSDMTDAEKGALLLAKHEGKVIELRDGSDWFVVDPAWAGRLAYRVKPEPVRETVTMYGNNYAGKIAWTFGLENDSSDTHLITFDTVDGVPVCDSIRMEAL